MNKSSNLKHTYKGKNYKSLHALYVDIQDDNKVSYQKFRSNVEKGLDINVALFE